MAPPVAAAATATSPLAIGAFAIQGFGSIANAWIQWKGLKEGRKESRRGRAFQKEMWERAEGIRQRERKEDVAIRKEEFGEQKSLNAFNKRQTFLDGVLTQLNRKPGLTNNFINAQRGRK